MLQFDLDADLDKARAEYHNRNVELGEHLRGLRQVRGVKAAWIAMRIGVSKSRLCWLEKGRCRWTDKLRCDYLDALNINTKPNRKTKHHGNKTNGNPRD